MRFGFEVSLTRRILRGLVAAGALTAAVAVALSASSANAAPASAGGTVVTTVSGPFGKMLIVGAGKYQGYTLYMFTSDESPKSGCTTMTVKLGKGSGLSCTGPESDQNAEWPALTTTGSPVAGAGIEGKLLGTVKRPGIGIQVTYAGHPLYLFDQGPGQITGAGFVESGLPPWHGAWYLLTPSGTPLNWPDMLTETTIKGKSVLAALIETLAGTKAEPLYSFSKDNSSTSACSGTCAAAWPPLITDGSPGVESPLSESHVGTIHRSDGTTQVTYDGKPLYFFSAEAPTKVQADDGEAFINGNGSGLKLDGGSFQLVTP